MLLTFLALMVTAVPPATGVRFFVYLEYWMFFGAFFWTFSVS